MNQELDKVLYHAVSSYQLLEVMLHRLLFHSESQAVLLLPDFIVEKYPQWPLLERRGFFNQVRLFPYLRIRHGEESQTAVLALAAYEQLTVEHLREGGLIATCPPPIYPPALFPLQNQIMGERGPDQMLFCDSLEIVCTLVEAGYGFAIMADLPPARLPGLRYIPVPQFDPISFGVVYRADGLGPALRLFLSELMEQMEPK